ncbi:MAG: hypothetical protein M1540_06130 [Candidatus Bathyarchaeota archaeon]|nr:hypothetical protein [Candidatus Bathyarchaeota archaeon]
MPRQINYVALVAGVLTLVLIAASVFVPWWQFNVGNPALASVNFSPVNFNLALFNTILTVPIIWALNLACLLTLLAGGISLLVYSVLPTKSYAKSLLGFGYKKPLYAVILFMVELIVLYLSVTLLTGVNLPLIGSASLQLPDILSGGITVKVAVSAFFNWTFYFAIAVVVLCFAARVYHRKAAKPVTSISVSSTN